MIDLRYIKFLVLAAAACTLVAIYIWFRQGTVNIALAVVSYFIGAVFTSLVTIRLPVFRQYFAARSREAVRKYRGFANDRAAGAMTGLVAGSVLGGAMFLFGVADAVSPAFIGALSAMVIGQYHANKL